MILDRLTQPFRSVWSVIKDFYGGTKRRNRINKSGVDENLSSDKSSPAESSRRTSTQVAEDLFKRLSREVREKAPHVRKMDVDADDVAKLADEVVRLMFGVTKTPQSFTEDKLIDAFKKKTALMLQWNVFYIYVDTTYPLNVEQEFPLGFYSRLCEIAKQVSALTAFINDQFKFGMRSANIEPVAFDPEKTAPRSLRNFLPVHFIFCRKNFGAGMRGAAFVVGRSMLHDREAILRFENERQQDEENRPGAIANGARIVVRVMAAGQHGDAGVLLNAHRFSDYGSRPQPESVIYVGDWRNGWEFSVGAADHDEIQCPGLGDASSTAMVLNPMLENERRWNFAFWPPGSGPDGLPLWFKCSDKEYKPADGEIHISFRPNGLLNQRILDFVGRAGYAQRITLVGRLLSFEGGQIEEIADDRGLAEALDELTVVSATRVSDYLWLVRSAEGSVYRVILSEARWEPQIIKRREKFAVGEVRYMWSDSAELGQLHFCGILLIFPESRAGDYNANFTVDSDAPEVVIGYNKPFQNADPDSTLGSGGSVKIKCVEVNNEGRGKYALIPIRDNSRYRFFAFQSTDMDESWMSAERQWLRYGGDEESDLGIDSEGFAVFENRRIIADHGAYNLVCGTSFFQLKISGTPAIKRRVVSESSSQEKPAAELQRAAEDFGLEAAADEIPTGPYFPSSQNVGIRLLNTRWNQHQLEYADQSNFAMHYKLTNGDDKHFLKAYYAQSVGSAKREPAFYELYGERAEELYIQKPDEVLRLVEEELPWGIVFPLLDRVEEIVPEQDSPTLNEIISLGYCLSTLSAGLADDNLVNLDMDKSTICFNSTGRATFVDFDNVFQLVGDSRDPSQLQALKEIIEADNLPAKNPRLPPEARAVNEAKRQYERLEALRQINPSFSAYMTAIVLLDLGKKNWSEIVDGNVRVLKGAIVQSALVDGESRKAALALEVLLAEMLNPDHNVRMGPRQAATRFKEIARGLSREDDESAREIMAITGNQIRP